MQPMGFIQELDFARQVRIARLNIIDLEHVLANGARGVDLTALSIA